MAEANHSALTLDEALALLYEEDDEGEIEKADVIIVPPEADSLTDEEDVNDDIIGEISVQDVPGTLEVHVEKDISKECAAYKDKPTRKKRKFCDSEPVWMHKDANYSKIKGRSQHHIELLQEMKEKLGGLSPLELFEKLMTPSIYEFVIRETVRYAATCKNKTDFTLSADELKTFIGILLFSGYHKVPSERDYWSNDEDLCILVIKKAMSRNRYQLLKSVVHFCNNEEANNHKDDKGFKIRSLLSMITKSFQQFGVFEECISVDEMIVKYYGHNCLKQFLRGKPIRFGYKLWALCGTSGYCYNFDLYCGKRSTAEHNDGMLLGSKVVMNMLEAVKNPDSHSVFFDNFFTGYDLLVHLRNLGYQATGTIRENRLRKCPLKPTNIMKKEERGSYDSAFDTNEEILFVRWSDNKCVCIGTNYDTIEPVHKVKRWQSEIKAKGEISQPNVVKSYSTHMRGVDHHDWLAAKYATSLRGKKWYWPIFTRILDMAVVNAWIIHKFVHEGKDQLNLITFRREICVPYLKLGDVSGGLGKKSYVTSPSTTIADARYDGKGHVIAKMEKQRRCQGKLCTRKPKTYCLKCNITLCIECFATYHRK